MILKVLEYSWRRDEKHTVDSVDQFFTLIDSGLTIEVMQEQQQDTKSLCRI